MKIDFTKEGKVSITAETKAENQMLFSIVNNGKIGGDEASFAGEEFKGRGKYDRSKAKKAKYKTECPVDGCGEKVKNTAIHFHKKHGIHQDGTTSDYFLFNGAKINVRKPVVKLPNGTYRVRPVPTVPSLLG